MEFLSNAIISSQDSSLLGAVITHFDTENYTKRCETRLYTTEELIQNYPSFQPRGFVFKDGGVLMGDTSVHGAVVDSAFEYMTAECSKFGQKLKDMTDLVLIGVDCGGYVLPNYQSTEAPGAFIPFSSYKVSNSSFNIYASYKNENDEFRTHSLLQLEDGSAIENIIALPEGVDLSNFSGTIEEQDAVEIEGKPYKVYKVVVGLTEYYAGVGEAFLNFLAYNVAFYNIGEKLLKQFRDSVSPPAGYAKPAEEGAIRIPRKAKVNVAIEHVYKEPRLRGILGCSNDVEALQKFVNDFPEAAITWHWLCRMYKSPWFLDNMGRMDENQALYIAATNLLPICRQERLKYAVELLTHRYYLASLGPVGDTLGLILHGGGVSGESIKRADFWVG